MRTAMIRVMERISYMRFANRLETEDLTTVKSDRQIFLEVSEIYRLRPNLVLEKLKSAHPDLYNRFKENHEN